MTRNNTLSSKLCSPIGSWTCPARLLGPEVVSFAHLVRHGPGVRYRALGRVAPDVRMRPFLAPGAWQGEDRIQWKGTIRMTARGFGLLPHPSPGAYKRRILKPSALSLSLHFLACLPRTVSACLPSPLLRLSLHCTSLSACRCICALGWCVTDVLLHQCGPHISTSPGKVMKQEITC